jgi:hypothetical protein
MIWMIARMDVQDDSPIQGYYYTCKSGARTLGICAHITSVLWFIGYARHEHVRYPSSRLFYTIRDAANRPPQENPDNISNVIDI